jgi:hypothetical protein
MKKITLMFLFVTALALSQNGPIDFEAGGNGASWTWTVFENDSNPPLEIIANPDPSGLNTSATVAKFTALQAGAPFAGVESMHGSDIGTFTLDASNALVKIMVWKSVISDVGIKFATASSASDGEIKVANTLVNQWEELTFDFSSRIGLPASTDIDQIVVFPDFDARVSDNIVYFDSITFSSGVAGDPVGLPVTFENTNANYNIEGFEGAESTIETNPDQSGINTSATVLKTIKTVGAQFYAGTILSLNVPIDFTPTESIAIKTWSPKANIPVRVKLENADASQFVELDVNTTVENQWEELVWDFSGMTAGINFTKVIVFFEFIDPLPGDGSTYYYDDIKVVGSLGLNDNDSVSVITFPNPVKSVWNVEAMEEISEITIYNILGQIVHKASPNSASYVADLSSMDSGVYLVQIVSSAGTTTKRVVKQ